MIVRCFVVSMMMITAAGSAWAQTPRPPATPQPAAPARAAQPPAAPAPAAPAPAAPPARQRPQGQSVNIKIEATITDQQGTSPPVKKTVTVVAADASNGSVRTNAAFNVPVGPVPLNMDAEPTLLSDGKVRVSLRLQYDLPGSVLLGRNAGGEERQPQRTSIQESLTLVLENGKSVVAAQSADPVSDRQVTLEVKATILR